MAAKTFTMRMPEDVYAQVKARKKGTVTSFVMDAVREKLARERRAELARGFQNLTGSVDMDEVLPWMGAQREAMKHIDD